MRVNIPTSTVTLQGDLNVPENATGIVIFVHGSGSSRLSPRNIDVASKLNAKGLATLLFDLLAPSEEVERSNVFDINLLTSRLIDVTKWVDDHELVGYLPIGYFGASTGAAAAIMAAATLDETISAVVSRGGRVDMAGIGLDALRAPALLIVGEHDELVLDLNLRAQRHLSCENKLFIVPGATHLFEEPGALDTVARLAANWFLKYLHRPIRISH